MSGWPRWDQRAAPGALAQYVQRGVVATLLPEELAARLPGPSDEPARERARRIYQVLAEHGISYQHEPSSSGPGKQAIRHPGEVLPGHGRAPAWTLRSPSAAPASTPGCIP